ncbi:hypothetical protein BO82DRAFT_408715, partial [Aspergillus uvarum CBS 121591]
ASCHGCQPLARSTTTLHNRRRPSKPSLHPRRIHRRTGEIIQPDRNPPRHPQQPAIQDLNIQHAVQRGLTVELIQIHPSISACLAPRQFAIAPHMLEGVNDPVEERRARPHLPQLLEDGPQALLQHLPVEGLGGQFAWLRGDEHHLLGGGDGADFEGVGLLH